MEFSNLRWQNGRLVVDVPTKDARRLRYNASIHKAKPTKAKRNCLRCKKPFKGHKNQYLCEPRKKRPAWVEGHTPFEFAYL